jgi:hypothetical protein
MKPTFLIIGAQKAGTTTLHADLAAHPDVFTAPVKELNFFVAEMNHRRGWSWYEGQFETAPKDAAAIGEASPSYTFYPAFVGVPKRIASTIPEARLIYLVREPFSRIQSSWLHAVVRGVERRAIDEAVINDIRYTSATMYGMQVREYLDWFPREQLLLVNSEDLRSRRQETVTEVLRFIGADPDQLVQPPVGERNVSADRRVPRPALRRLYASRGWQRLREIAPSKVVGAASRPLTRALRPTDVEMSAHARRVVADRLATDIELLERLTGFAAGWKLD